MHTYIHTYILYADKRSMKRLSAVVGGESDECITIPVNSWMKNLVVSETSTSKIAVSTVKLCGLSSIEVLTRICIDTYIHTYIHKFPMRNIILLSHVGHVGHN